MKLKAGAIILCGGESVRMGRDKAALPFGRHATLLGQMVSILEQVMPRRQILIVAGHEQSLPIPPDGVTIMSETEAGRGPLAALVFGLQRLPFGVDAAFVCGCDAPLLKPEFVDRLLELGQPTDEAVIPADDNRLYPLAAVYRPKCLPRLRSALAEGERSLHRALRRGHVIMREVRVEHLRDVDPNLDSLVNCNTPEEYEQALRRARLTE
jgi:molybdopterin-guanine dinucleotide biosynthesis protein A